MKRQSRLLGSIFGILAVLLITSAALAAETRLSGSACVLFDGATGQSVTANYSGTFIKNPSTSAKYALCPLQNETSVTYTAFSAAGSGNTSTACFIWNGTGNSSGTATAYYPTMSYVTGTWSASWTGLTFTPSFMSFVCYLPSNALVSAMRGYY
jgi:hypothetical protein